MIGAILARRAVSAGFAALNQHDLAAFMKGWADDATWIFPGDLSVSGTFVGKPAIQKWFEKFTQQFPTTQFTVRNMLVADIFALAGNNAIAVEWELALVNRVRTAFAMSPLQFRLNMARSSDFSGENRNLARGIDKLDSACIHPSQGFPVQPGRATWR